MKTTQILIITISLFILSACGDGSDNDSQTALKGTFIDSAVEGVTYITVTQSGTTDSAGTFTYLPGETVSFYIGDILIGSAVGAGMLTPLDFVPGAIDETDPEVTNILRFVQSLDEDSDPDNGITITAATAAAAIGQSLDFSASNINFESEADALLSLLTGGAVTALIDAATAQAHFVGSMGGPSPTVGTLTLTGADTVTFGVSTTDPVFISASASFIQWRQVFPDTSQFEVAIVLNGPVINEVFFTWNDGGIIDAAYAISCPGPSNPFPFYTVGDCSNMAIDTVTQEVTFDATLEISTILPGVASGPLAVDGILAY